MEGTMAAWNAILLLAAIAGADDTVLLEFSTSNCEPCRMMEPVIRRLQSDGFAVQQINAESQPQAARQFRVDSFPTFVLIRNGREQGRIVGATSYDRLVQLFPASSAPSDVGQIGRAHATQEATSSPASLVADVRALNRNGDTPRMGRSNGSAEQTAYRATIRLKVEDAKGFGYGTGTIIDNHGEEALAVTCGHLFRESKGQGTISVDLFSEGQTRTVPGQLIDYNLERDVALVSLRPGVQITPVQVAPGGFRSRPGERVFSIGCDKGANPTVRASTVAAVNKYSGHPNITVKGQPVDGRSGGGLFTADGQLIGVCNAADPADDEGLFAGLEAVHWQLDQIGQQAIYQRASHTLAATPVSAPPINPTQLQDDRPLPAIPERMPSQVAQDRGLGPISVANSVPARPVSAVQAVNTATDAVAASGDYEMICIVRPKGSGGAAGGQVFVVDNASAQLVQQVARTSRILSPEQGLAGVTAALGDSANRMVNRFQSSTAPIQR
jgi:thiol-disulfide isomerase/thioredoxin